MIKPEIGDTIRHVPDGDIGVVIHGTEYVRVHWSVALFEGSYKESSFNEYLKKGTLTFTKETLLKIYSRYVEATRA